MDLENAKVLVAGGAGFIGSHVCDALIRKGADVTVLDNLVSGNLENIAHIKDKLKFIKGDITDFEQVLYAAKDCDVIIHEAFPAAICDLSPENQFIATGTLGTYNLLRAALANDSVFIYASSISVYGKQVSSPITESHPLNPIVVYGATKLAGEFYCRAFQQEQGLKNVILRYSDVYGPRYSRISAPIAFLLKGLKKEPLQIHGDGSQTRDYTYVTDIAEGTVLAINEKAYGDVFNIASGNYISILELAKKVNVNTENDSEIELIPSEKIDTQKYVAEDERKYSIDISKAKKILGYNPKVSLDTGLGMSKEWIIKKYQKVRRNR